jgi:hypothetical protein
VKIEYHEDVAVPADFVFRRLSDVARHERKALARGVAVRRVDGGTETGPGATWEIAFDYRGRRREVRAEITGWTPPEKLRIDAQSGGLDIHIVVTVVALSPRMTRVHVALNLVARSITARLLVQSLKLGRGSVTNRLQGNLKAMCAEIADAWDRRQAAGGGV